MSNALQIQLNVPMKDVDGCRALMAAFHKQIINALPKHIPEGVFSNAILNSVRKSELAYQQGKAKTRLTDCTGISMLSAMMCCAETGLMPDSPAQECHLIPFGKQVTWMPGYRGLIKLAKQSGDIADVESAIVCEGDKFSYRLGLKPNLVHVPKLGDDRGELMYVYAILRFKDARIRPRFEVMDKKMIDKIRAAAPGKNSDAWVKHYDEKARITCLKRLLKTAPFSPQLFSAIDRDNQIEVGEDQELHDTVKELVENVAELRKPATDKLAESAKKAAVKSGAMPATTKMEQVPIETVEPEEQAEVVPESVLLDEAVAVILQLAGDNASILSERLLTKCSEDNLSVMCIEALGVVKAEIEEQIDRANEEHRVLTGAKRTAVQKKS